MLVDGCENESEGSCKIRSIPSVMMKNKEIMKPNPRCPPTAFRPYFCPSFLPYCLLSSLPSFLPSFLPSSLRAFCPPFLLSSLPSFFPSCLLSFHPLSKCCLPLYSVGNPPKPNIILFLINWFTLMLVNLLTRAVRILVS